MTATDQPFSNTSGMPALDQRHRFSDAEISAVYKAIALRRDIRHFQHGHVPEEQLARLLAAAHQPVTCFT